MGKTGPYFLDARGGAQYTAPRKSKFFSAFNTHNGFPASFRPGFRLQSGVAPEAHGTVSFRLQSCKAGGPDGAGGLFVRSDKGGKYA